jgi:hypothetical protein
LPLTLPAAERWRVFLRDKLAEKITGDPQFFWLSGHSAGGQSLQQKRAKHERELRWQALRRKY